MYRIAPYVQWLLAFLASVVAAWLGLKAFGSWEQVQVLWDGEADALLLVGHAHLPRYIVAYPGLVLEEMIPNLGFAWYVGAFFATNVVLFGRLSAVAIGRRPGFAMYALFVAAHFAMNGRGVIAWTAWLLACWLCIESTRGDRLGFRLLWVLPCALLASVSTGVYVVVISALAVFLFRYWHSSWRENKFGSLALLVMSVPVLWPLLDYFTVAASKNIEFYGGGVRGAIVMLEHGLGFVVFKWPLLSAIVVALLVLAGGIALLMVHGRRRWDPLNKLIAFALAGGLFGFTVLTLAIPLVLLRVRRRTMSVGLASASASRFAQGRAISAHGGDT